MKYTIIFLLCTIQLAYSWPTCSDQPYCDEIRNDQTPTTWHVDTTTFQYFDNQMNVTIINGQNSARLTVASVNDDIFRITLNELDTNRYSPLLTLDGEPSRNIMAVTDGATYTEFNSGVNLLRMHYDPLKFEVYNADKLIMVINENGRLNFNTREDNNAISIDVKFFETQTAYGIPEHAEQLSLQYTEPGGRNPYRLYNADYPAYPIGTQEALYGAVPVLYAHGIARSSGIFWLNSAETFVDIAYSDNVDSLFISESGVLDMFILSGPTLKDAIKQYTSLTGTTPLPSLFTLGHHQCRWSYMSEEDVLGVINGFETHDFPLDVIWLDIDYTEDFKYFTWNFDTFPNPQGMVEYIVSIGKKVVAIIDPHIKVEEGYEIFDICKLYGYFVKASDGITDYEANCWPGLSSWIDFMNPEAESFYASRFVYFTNRTQGLHIWNDMNEPAVFDVEEKTMPRDNVHYTGILHRDVHNIYGFTQTKATHKGLQYRNETIRPFVLTRSHFAGSQRYAAVWTGDNVASWEHLKISIPMCLTLSISGVSFCGADVGGFDGNPTEELLQRWYQTGAWLPFFRAHSAQGTDRREPYLFGEETQGRIRNALRERYFHLPLWYTLFFEHERTGEPVIRPMSYHYSSDSNTLNMDDQYLVGNNVLVHPVTDLGANEVQVYLPGGAQQYWYDIVNNLGYTGLGYHPVPVNMDSIPVFYRGGSILARREVLRMSSKFTHDDPYTLYIFLNSDNTAESTLYYDDYETLDYNKKLYAYYNMVYTDDDGVRIYRIDADASFDRTLQIDRMFVYRLGVSDDQYQRAMVGSLDYQVVYADDYSHFVVELNMVVDDDVVIRFV